MVSVDECLARTFSCACLNVTVESTEPVAPSTDPAWLTINFANHDAQRAAISVTHLQLTVRERAPAVSATVQHVGLVCLVCSTQVYRVPTTINPGEPLVDGPIVPSADHVEVSLLLSSTGVIDIARTCLTGDALRAARDSVRLSNTLHILCPRDLNTTATRTPLSPLSPQHQHVLQPSPQYKLPDLPAPTLFAPPPYSPAQAAFAHLAKLAQERSQQLRHAEHAQLQQEINDRLARLDAQDLELKAEVDAVWKASRQGLYAVKARIQQQSDDDVSTATPSPYVWASADASSDDESLNGLAIRPNMNRNASSGHNISALSMSLQQRQFHVPAVRPAVQEVREPSPDNTDDSSDPTHPHTPQMRQHALDDAAALPFVRRKLDWNADVSTSVRIKSILSQDRPPKQPKKKAAPVAASLPALTLQPAPGVVPGTGSSVPPVSPKRSSVIKTNGGTPERGGTRRKVVTFGEQPEVKVIDATPTPAAEMVPPPASVVEEHVEEEAIFDLEGLDEDHLSPLPPPPRAASLSQQARATPNGRSARTTTLLASMSYRAPSSIDRAASSQANAQSALMSTSAPAPSVLAAEQFKPHEQQLRQLVGADLPSHRAGWKKDGKAWAMFSRGRAKNSALAPDDEDENGADVDADNDGDESDSDDDDEERQTRAMQFGAGSLPIAITPIAQMGSLGRQRIAESQTRLGTSTRLATVDETGADLAEPATARERAQMIAEGRLGA